MEHLENIPIITVTFVRATFVLATFVHIRNISAVTDPTLQKNQRLSKLNTSDLSLVATKVVQVVWRVLVTNREKYQTLHNVNKMFCDKYEDWFPELQQRWSLPTTSHRD